MTNVMNCVLLLKLKAVLNIICLPVFGITRKYKKQRGVKIRWPTWSYY